MRAARFPRRRARGYDPDQVHALLDRVADALSGRARVSPEQVRAAVFREVPGGYEQQAVDRFLAGLEWQLAHQALPPTSLRSGRDLLAVELPRSTSGYDRAEVDAFLARAALALDGGRRMTAGEVRHTRFTTTSGMRRGYRVREVDNLLDELERELRFRGR
ncbi:DivIVA domain-containing protein [Actinosynnema mirum]|uniref:DivIVA domain-containing protein n=1 Tax=Actinosynnema mirum (strain ATCC 29888 / DSM 43827 / JCM 3225 / NBRC 14064 / NCIMB 13271 / NRRL B-12336 / IMRU 3971 / 101) TaxID=446462 RepID=C6WJI5_ACTMD|nr:DivIVA domain-containing protein [Actinosynnema mirum]ACU34617.1 hypothetical protein Amir_0654 [Actinosynnema mirum DSM 43827]AXX27979.1 Cell division protein FtsI [Actinosynnema pretiosum subsp. pretiosum]